MEEKNIWQIKPFESLELNNELMVTRVPGGWIYRFMRLDAGQMNAVFVPYVSIDDWKNM